MTAKWTAQELPSKTRYGGKDRRDEKRPYLLPSADSSKYGSTIARRFNYSLSMLLLIDERIIRNMQCCLQKI